MEYPPAVQVGVMLSAFGVFWTGESLGVRPRILRLSRLSVAKYRRRLRSI